MCSRCRLLVLLLWNLAWKDISFMVWMSTSWPWVPTFDFEFCTLAYSLIAVVASTQFFILHELTFVIWWLKIFSSWKCLYFNWQKYLECRLLSYLNACWLGVPTSLEGPPFLWLKGTGELFSPPRYYLGIPDTFKLLISWCLPCCEGCGWKWPFHSRDQDVALKLKLWTNVKDDVFQNLQICDGCHCLLESTSHL